jgi:hypothetical protein
VGEMGCDDGRWMELVHYRVEWSVFITGVEYSGSANVYLLFQNYNWYWLHLYNYLVFAFVMYALQITVFVYRTSGIAVYWNSRFRFTLKKVWKATFFFVMSLNLIFLNYIFSQGNVHV